MDTTVKPHLSNQFIDYHAIGMIKHLQKAGHTAYLVGGCVRDLLVGQIPKDFDIGTTALPQEVRRLVSYAFIIGRRFRLVLVKREDKQYEVATFRREPAEGEFPEGVPFGDNIFGTPEEDASRRDFTCNALFYDPVAEKVIDYIEGQKDVERHIIRMIGNPKVRLAEDPIRILRALRFSHKLHFRIEPELRAEMHAFAESLPKAVLPRRREEYLKLLRLHDPTRAFREAFDLNILKFILPELHAVYEKDEFIDLFDERLQRLDSRLVNTQDTALLAGTVMLGWLRARHGLATREDELIKSSYTHDEHFVRLAKDQMGLHNWEMSVITRAISIQKMLTDPEDFRKRGQKRRNALLFNEAFPLAVNLAHIDALLDPEILEFWDAQLDLAVEQSSLHDNRSRQGPGQGRSPAGRGRNPGNRRPR
jgi:poly(A) polymerase